MRPRMFAGPVVGLAMLLAGGTLPAAAQAASAPAATTPTAVAAQVASLSPGALPADGDPAWSRTFTELFQDPSLSQWRNVGSRPMSDCLRVEGGKGILTPYPNGDGKAWQCRVTSDATFSSGTYIFAARVKVHSSQGHLSSFWLNSAPGVSQANEIDVIENAGVKDPAVECKGSATVHVNRTNFNGLNQSYYDAYEPRVGYKYCFSKAESAPLQDNSMHTFHAVYTPGGTITYYADGVQAAQYPAPHDTPLTLILTNILPDGAAQPAPGAKDFEVEWVKTWKQNPAPASPCADNDHWRAQFGVAPYDYQPNSDQSQANQKRYVFDRIFYYYTYADVRTWAQNKVATQGGNLWDHVQWHWLHYGIPQGRTGAATFDPVYYMNTNPDVSAAYGWNNYQGAIEHYVAFGRNEGRRGSVVFDPAFYRSCYGDLGGMSNAALLEHFTKNGMDEGRQGSADFAPAWYLAAYPDVRSAFGSNNYRGGMIHWISGGRGEGRAGHP